MKRTVLHMHRGGFLHVLSVHGGSVLDMTTTTEHKLTVILCELRKATTCITAEHHPDELHPGMRYSVRVSGGRNAGTVINCATEASAVRLFGEVVEQHNQGIVHPFLMPVN